MVKVFVSGASGFIAQHVVKLLVSKGYKVIGSVRSIEKGEQLKKDLVDFEYEIVEDIAVPGAFDEALKKHTDVTVFLHTASPFHYNTTDVENDLLKPAIEGTKNALKSIQEYAPQVEKVVVTSSMAAVYSASGGDASSPPLTEESWNDITFEESKANARVGYLGSKALAEKAAWEFLKTKKPNFTMNTVNPTLVFGPQAFPTGLKETLNTSSEILNGILKAGTDELKVPARSGFYIDVRDVAKAHLHAFESDVTNFRYVVVGGPFCVQEAMDIINENIPSLKGKISVGEPGSGEEIMKNLVKVDNSKTRELLGDFISLEQSVIDSINQIISK